ncbi:tRNA pseudouridine(38-40) synthase (EC [Olavius algarvensis Delta 1 endosymbiont]|nr:tRNA pseudouridine(38-40) synthase (EC [Olavius algarvensis Delta 1 endosymbiont]
MTHSNFKIIIEYDGTHYHGWQRQKDDRTIQQEIENALSAMTAERVTLTGSGRTDAGVHAYGQVANFICDTGLSETVFQKGLNSILPDDIVIKDCRLVNQAFHARYDAKSKIYHYQITNRDIPSAIGRQYAWFIRRKLDTAAMRAAISHIIGSQDFKSFEGTGSPRSHTTRNIMAAGLTVHEDGLLVFQIEADGFLRYMVRNIVGTLVDIGLGKITPAEFKKILESRNRSNASATAPARGLFLMEVKY